MQDLRKKIVGTPKHNDIKQKNKDNMKGFRKDIVGTPKHDELNLKNRGNMQSFRKNMIGTPKHNESKRKMRDSYSNIIGTPKHDKIKRVKRDIFCARKNTTSLDRITKFTQLINEGPYFICVICNRCHYERSVLLFNIDNYEIDIDHFYHNIHSFDGSSYICKTCHRKLKKSDIPAQAVWNKLAIFNLPEELSSLNRLERVIISRRILFKKIAIMTKGQAPKLKGSICNVPIDTNDIASTLPQGADSNGIVMVKLKRKLMYRGHVYFKAVSPELVRSALHYLKLNNHLYSDIEIDLSQIPKNLLSLADSIEADNGRTS